MQVITTTCMFNLTSTLHFRIPHCCTEEKSVRLRTHPCLTPDFIGKQLLKFDAPFLLPVEALNYLGEMLKNTMCIKSGPRGPQFRPTDSIKCFGQIRADNRHRFAHSRQLVNHKVRKRNSWRGDHQSSTSR